MRDFDGDYIDEAIARLEAIEADARPRWGRLDRDGLIEHLIWALMHSMGRSHKVPFMGNALTLWVIGPLVTRGFLPIPKNLQLPKRFRKEGITAREPGTLEDLKDLLRTYLALVQADELEPALHPGFGDIGVDGWARMHVLHFEHHFRQFGV